MSLKTEFKEIFEKAISSDLEKIEKTLDDLADKGSQFEDILNEAKEQVRSKFGFPAWERNMLEIRDGLGKIKKELEKK